MAIRITRIVPKLGAEFYKSYALDAPLATHWRPATCAEFECDAFLHGWVTVVDTSTELGRRQHDFITHDRSRSHREERTGDVLVTFTFGPGQEMFKGTDEHDHRVAVGRPPLMLIKGGDYRGNPRQVPTVSHVRIEDWVDDCATQLDRLARAQS